ncbi:MAG: hypothetical protein AAGC83_04560 [Pseudomonadota bacterium]
MSTPTRQGPLAFGLGDLYLPIGWSAIDRTGLLTTSRVLPETVFIVELARDYWDFLPDMVAEATVLAALIDIEQTESSRPASMIA